MKSFILLLSFSCVFFLSGFDLPSIEVLKTFTPTQIKDVEKEALKLYGIKVTVNVISRNGKDEITNLEFKIFDENGRKTSSCSSDNFGILVIRKDGCSIADLGHEDRLK